MHAGKNGHATQIPSIATAAKERPHIKPYFKLSRKQRVLRSSETEGPWEVPGLCTAYRWPSAQPGGGVIAIVELGGGWLMSDMETFFAGINQPLPKITDVSVDGTTNTAGSGADGPDGEVALDIQIAAATKNCATGKAATIRVYWAQDIASAVRRATADGCDTCTVSWGAGERMWGAAAAVDMQQAALEATQAGMIVFAAARDND